MHIGLGLQFANLDRRASDAAVYQLELGLGARAEDAGEILAARVIELMRATAMPNGLTALGFDESHVDALATGAEPQYRVIRNAPKDVGRDDLRSLFRAALSYW